MRHSRAKAFDEALHSVSHDPSASHWSAVANDPNDPRALADRAEKLRRTWRPDIPDRIEYLMTRCSGKRVLDIGCVAHDIARMSSPMWLHAQLASAATFCLGVDIDAAGVTEMQRLGYDALTHDLSAGPGPLSDLEPFDVIMAGELIEHVSSVDMLFDTAAQLLSPNGELIITTPNPWAPHRVRAGQLGFIWENTDHILFAFPSGMAELADRHHLALSEVATTSPRTAHAHGIERVKAARRRLRGRQWMMVGFASTGERRTVRVDFGRLGRAMHGLWRPRRRFLGETFVYVIRRPASERIAT